MKLFLILAHCQTKNYLFRARQLLLNAEPSSPSEGHAMPPSNAQVYKEFHFLDSKYFCKIGICTRILGSFLSKNLPTLFHQ